eukprot:TRINITY_DN5134_c0_g1_i3.p2 TRINITY_DN5134_c0_g1~~TRINITY_DN5134_c0_g1_i3.p2  ORF type:complete len:147 (-),score=49.63 TRINITY_DN5134_c0_g1_i3:463-903(-)
MYKLVSARSFTRLATRANALPVVQRNMGFWSRFKGDEEREKRREYLAENSIIPGTPEFNAFYKDHKQSELAIQTGVPDQCIDDPLLHIAMMKYNRIKEKLGVTDSNENSFLENYDISAGVQSLEAVFDGDMPHHTFDENRLHLQLL